MKLLKNLILFVVVLCMTVSYGQDKDVKLPSEFPFGAPDSESRGVFGEDGREEVNDVSGITHYTNATAVMIPKNYVDGNKAYGYSLRQSLSMQFGTDNFADNVKFLDQPTVANCTGFLVAPDIMVTAGHCINSMEEANKWYWLFDYTSDMQWNLDGNYVTINRDNLYEVSEILGSKLEGEEDDELEDYAVMKLDRVVTDRKPYRIRSSGDASASTNVYTIGSPTGLPLKISLDSEVLNEGNDYWFKTNIDAFPGNSGGPVFDPNGYIEGILVRGAVEYANGRYTGDYKYNQECDCIQTVTFAMAGLTAGCQIHKINSIPYYLIKRIIYDNLERAIRRSDNDEYDRWAVYEWILHDSYTMERGAFESLAMDYDNNYALNKLITVNTERYESAFGRTILEYALSNGTSDLRENALDNLDIDATDPYGRTLLEQYTIDNNVNLVQLLFEYGANPKVTDSDGNNLLQIAVTNDSYSLIDYYIESGNVDLEGLNNDNRTLLQVNVLDNNLEMVKSLINNGANKYVTDSRNNTLLHYAAKYGSEELVNYLLKEGLKADKKNKDNRLPEKIAKRANRKEMAKLLKKAKKRS